jgi:CheY-like chemotaxis protein
MVEQVRHRILVVDDCEDDRLLLRRGLKQLERVEIVGEAEDGQAAIDYLSGIGGYVDRERFPVPDTILLDLNMPGLNGFDVLRWLQSQDITACRIVILSSSGLPVDKENAKLLGAHAYVVKGSMEQMASRIAEVLAVPRRTGPSPRQPQLSI